MANLTKHHNNLFDSVFPSWTQFDRFDNYLMNNDPWTATVGHRPNNKYRWDENDDAYSLDIVMPGLTKKDIDLTFKEGVLSIKCKKEVDSNDTKFYGVKTEQSFSNLRFNSIFASIRILSIPRATLLSADGSSDPVGP